MAVCPDFALQMMMQSKGWKTSKGKSTYEIRRLYPITWAVCNRHEYRKVHERKQNIENSRSKYKHG